MTWRIHKSQLTSRLEQLFGEEFRQNQPLAKFTSARVGGEAELFVVVKSADELQKAAELAFEYSAPWFILGGGSNILISDHGFSGLVIQNRSRNMSFRNAGYSVLCSADSGLNLSSLTRQCINKGLGGLEWGINVPGTVGGAVFGNAGAHGADMASNVASVTLWKPGLGLKTLRKEEMKYSYRSSILKQDAQRGAIRPVILSAELQLKPEEIRQNVEYGFQEALDVFNQFTDAQSKTMYRHTRKLGKNAQKNDVELFLRENLRNSLILKYI